jgi:hypothetical protein
MDEALCYIVTALNARKSLAFSKVMEACRDFSIPLDSFLEAARLLKVDKAIDVSTGEEQWEIP